jgi:ApaG protein
VSTAITHGVRVTVESRYIPEQSRPTRNHFVFAYHVTIANEGGETVQLRTRHWLITDAEGDVQEVRGDGVVGEQPILRPGERFEYTSGCVLATAAGSMQGTYQMFRENGEWFDAEIAPFPLALPYSLN